MHTHNICFCGGIRNIICGYPLLSGAMSYTEISKYETILLQIIEYE